MNIKWDIKLSLSVNTWFYRLSCSYGDICDKISQQIKMHYVKFKKKEKKITMIVWNKILRLGIIFSRTNKLKEWHLLFDKLYNVDE